jgi:hypothetical protein
MTVNAAYQQQDSNHPVAGGYIQPGAGVTGAIVTLSDTTGVSLTGAAGTGSAAVITVQGNASGTAIPVSGTVTASGVAQASTTSGQTGTLVQGATTTSAPTYTTAQTNPLSLTTAGSLRTVDNASVAQASTTAAQVGPLIQGAVTTGLATYTTAQTDPLSLDTSGRLRNFSWQYRDSTATVQTAAQATAPTAGTAVATLTTPAAGTYEISGTLSISGTTVVAADSNNYNLKKGGTTLLTNIPIAVNSTTGTPGAVPFGPVIVVLDGATSVTVNAVGNATGSSIYAAQLVGRLVG